MTPTSTPAQILPGVFYAPRLGRPLLYFLVDNYYEDKLMDITIKNSDDSAKPTIFWNPADEHFYAGPYRGVGADAAENYEVGNADALNLDVPTLLERMVADGLLPSTTGLLGPASTASDGPMQRAVLAFARRANDAEHRCIAFAAAALKLELRFPADASPVDMVEVENRMGHVQPQTLKATVDILVTETYCLTGFRGAGAEAAMLAYLTDLARQPMENLVTMLQPQLAGGTHTLELYLNIVTEQGHHGFSQAKPVEKCVHSIACVMSHFYDAKDCTIAFPQLGIHLPVNFRARPTR